MINNKNIESNRNTETYSAALKTARMFPSRKEVCRRMAVRGINPRENVVTGHAQEITFDAGMALLASIHAEIGDTKVHAEAAEAEQQITQYKAEVEKGPSLTTLCNTKMEHDTVTDTMDNVAALFVKYLRNAAPLDDWTDEENREAEVSLAAAVRARESGMTRDEATEAVAKAVASRAPIVKPVTGTLTPYALKLLARKG